MTKWEDYFIVEEVDLDVWNKHYPNVIKLAIKSTGQPVGWYKDTRYAEKQAKYKFKKIIKQVEKTLLG